MTVSTWPSPPGRIGSVPPIVSDGGLSVQGPAHAVCETKAATRLYCPWCGPVDLLRPPQLRRRLLEDHRRREVDRRPGRAAPGSSSSVAARHRTANRIAMTALPCPDGVA